MDNKIEKQTVNLPDYDLIDDHGTVWTLSQLASNYVSLNATKNAVERQAKALRKIIFPDDQDMLDRTVSYILTDPSSSEQFRFRPGSTVTTTVNKLLLLQYGLTDKQIAAAVKEKETKFWIIERVKTKKEEE